MNLTPTDFSLLFLGIMIVMVLLEVRRLGKRTPEPVSRLEAKMDALAQQITRRMAAGEDEIALGGGAQLVDLEQSLEDLSDEVDKLGRFAQLEVRKGDDGLDRFLAALDHLRRDIGTARQLFAAAADQLQEASDSMEAAGEALERIDNRLDTVLIAGGEATSIRSGSTAPAPSEEEAG